MVGTNLEEIIINWAGTVEVAIDDVSLLLLGDDDGGRGDMDIARIVKNIEVYDWGSVRAVGEPPCFHDLQ